MKLIQEKEPHIVLTDITMPIMDAFMMFEATRTLSYEKVILSGYNDFQNAKKAMQYGAVDFLSKPIDTQNQIIQQILEFVHQHYCMHFTISSIAENLGYSESYLYKVIKEDFPMTLNEYILRYRLKQAIDKMAESPNSPLSDISEQIGFSDYKYFAKVFKKYLHISPKELKLMDKNH